MKAISVTLFAAIFFVGGVVDSVAAAEVVPAPVVKSGAPKKSKKRPPRKNKKPAAPSMHARLAPAPAEAVIVPQDDGKAWNDETRSWQPYAYP